MSTWEVEIKVRRNGRLIMRESALGDDPQQALYFAHNDLERWAESHSEAEAAS